MKELTEMTSRRRYAKTTLRDGFNKMTKKCTQQRHHTIRNARKVPIDGESAYNVTPDKMGTFKFRSCESETSQCTNVRQRAMSEKREE